MPSFLHQPGYEDFPVRLAQGLWQHSSRWEPTDFEFFARARQASSQHILARPKIYQHKRRQSPSTDAFWVFKQEESGPPSGWAELQSFPGKHFGKAFLFFTLDALDPTAAQEALVALASLVFTLSRSDILHLVSGSGSRTLVDSLGTIVGSVETLTSLPTHAWHPESGLPQSYAALTVDRSSWRQCAALQGSMRGVKHIEMRMERLDRMDKGPKKKKKKRPFLVRLFKPRIDDSLF